MTEGQTGSMRDVAEIGPIDAADCVAWLARAEPVARKKRSGRDRIARAGVESAVEADVIPRMGMQHTRPRPAAAFDPAAVHELVALLLCRHQRVSLETYVETALARGLPVDHLFLGLFQPAARQLGEMWADDTCSFVDVTLAMTQLQTALRRFAPRFQRHGRPSEGTRSAVLATLPGDQHTFGLAMTAEFFRRGGWTVLTGTTDEVKDRVCGMSTGAGTLVGFSASRTDQIDELTAAIRRLRASCGGRIAGVLVGGPLFVTHPEQARAVGADLLGGDATDSLAQAEAFMTGVEDG